MKKFQEQNFLIIVFESCVFFGGSFQNYKNDKKTLKRTEKLTSVMYILYKAVC